jgi:hypothetical protein
VLGVPTEVKAVARLIETGADAEVATVMTHDGGAISTTFSSSRSAGPNTAVVLGTKARVEIERWWWSPSVLRVIDPEGAVLEEFSARPAEGEGRGMQYEAIAAERYVADGSLDSDLLPVAESVAIMGLLDEIRAQIGVRYPHETD